MSRIEVPPPDRHNADLVAAVHPPDWTNPEPAPRYDLVAIGAGAAGLVSAIGAAGLGARVAIVERHLMGGDCLNYGCVPSKALLASARAAADVRRAGAFGIAVPPGAAADFPRVMERLRRIRADIAHHDSAERLRGLGIDVFLGQAVFSGPDRLEVEGRTLRFARAVVATGARAAGIPIPGLAETGFLTNETVFSLTAAPRELAVIGAGPIGCELGQAFARLGVRVTMLEVAPRILLKDEAEAAAVVRRFLEADGVRILVGASIRRAARQGGRKVLEYEVGGEAASVAVDEILVSVGRAPNVEGIGLQAAGIAFDPKKGVQVDAHLRTTNPRVYAAGDVASRFQFTHAADAMARIVIGNALFPGRGRHSALLVPWCTYTDPEVAHVGLTRAEAAERGVEVDAFRYDLARLDRSIVDGETGGFLEVLVKRGGTDRIAGATFVDRHAGELIAPIAVAMSAGLGLGRIAKTILPYPTRSEAIKRVADEYNRTRLTPRARWFLGHWFRWRRR